MSDPGKAVFLSYASQDAAAAKRIADALRAAGVEVWFDQSELVGGDAWDQKIRRQIKDCALLIPIISAATQARTEGYFRLEWRLADQRTHLMAKGRPFLLPVVIDDTGDADAHVPDSFTDVQWTRLPAGETTSAFCARVKKLLEGQSGGGALRPDTTESSGRKAPPTANRQRWIAPVLGGLVVAVVALLVARPWQAPAPVTNPAAIVAAPLSEAQQLVAKAGVLLNKPEMARAELDAADALCKRASALDPTDADVWATWTHVHVWYRYHNLDSSIPRQEAGRECAARAMQLAPRSYEPRLAQALYWVRGDPTARKIEEVEGLLRELLQERPDEPRALYTLGYAVLWRPATRDEGIKLLERLAGNPAFAALAWDEIGWNRYFLGEPAKAEDAIARSLAAQPYWNNLGLKITMAERVSGDMDLAEATLKQMPASALQEDWGIAFACEVYQWRREPLRTIRVLDGLSRDWIHYFFNDYPKAFLLGEARLMANQTGAAQRDFQRARVLIEKQLADDPNNAYLLGLQARTLLYLGEKEEAAKSYGLVKELGSVDMLQVHFEPPDVAIAYIRSMALAPYGNSVVRSYFSPASLRLDPQFDRLRPEPGFQALLAELEAGNKSIIPAATAPVADAKSVAVLAFANLSDDKANEYFSDGISEELLNVLAKVPGLKVSARTSAFYFKGKEVPIPEIAKQLGVAYVVEGSVRKSGDKVRITAQLIKAADGFHVWSDTFTRDIKDVFAVQDEIAGLIAQQLQLKLAEGPAREQTVNPEAHQLYLQGRYFANQPSTANLAKAVDFLQRAVELDPTFAPAWGALARNVALQAEYLETTPESLRERFARARRAADRAIALAPKLSDGYFARFEIQTAYDYDWAGARDSLDTALTLAPADALLISNASQLATQFVQVPRSLELGRRAAELDPVNAEIRYWLGRTYVCAGLLTEGEAELRRAAELSPSLLSVHRQLSTVLVLQGRAAEAVGEARLEKDEWSRQASLVVACWAAKDVPASAAALARLIEVASESAAYQVAEGYAFRGESDKAFEWLDRAYRNRDSGFGQLRADPLLKSLRGDPRWAQLLKQAGLADEQLR